MSALAGQYELRGTFYECCRVEDGHCALWFARDLPHACTNLQTYEIEEGHVGGTDMCGVRLVYHHSGIGPRIADLKDGVRHVAIYVDAATSAEQRSVLEPFVREHLGIRPWREILGVKFAEIRITEHDGTYRVETPFSEQVLSLTTGGDDESPMRLSNPRSSTLSNVRFCRADTWTYRDHGEDMTFRNASGAIANFVREGSLPTSQSAAVTAI